MPWRERIDLVRSLAEQEEQLAAEAGDVRMARMHAQLAEAYRASLRLIMADQAVVPIVMPNKIG
jgi:hypothetical protein